MSGQVNISSELDYLACALLGAAIEALEKRVEKGCYSVQKTTLPVMLASNVQDEFLSFEQDSPDECYAAACEYIASLKEACNIYALVYEGAVQTADNLNAESALIVEFAQRGMECAYSGYVLWSLDKQGHVHITDPQPAGEETLLFA